MLAATLPFNVPAVGWFSAVSLKNVRLLPLLSAMAEIVVPLRVTTEASDGSTHACSPLMLLGLNPDSRGLINLGLMLIS
jgi:hypothetical protein